MLKNILNEVHEINEAKVQFWDILKHGKKVKPSGSGLSKTPGLDIAFYAGNVYINTGTTDKGIIYTYNDLTFATRFNSIKDLEIIYFENDEYSYSEHVSVNMLLKKLKPKKMPFQILKKAITTIDNVVKNKSGGLVVQFRNSATYDLYPAYYDDDNSLRDKMLKIDKGIFELEQMGFKTNKIKAALKILEPEIYNKRKINKFTSLESLDDYLKMNVDFGFQDTGGITGEGMGFSKDVNKDNITLSTYRGSQYYGDWTKFNIVLKVPITKKEVDNKVKSYIEYNQKMRDKNAAYSRGLADWVKSTGGHKGNPVWMD